MSRVADFWTKEGAKFVAFDRVLDARATGPQWLGRPDVARAVMDELFAGGEKGFYELGSWVVMPNHIHVLLRPMLEVSSVVSGIKVTTARAANRLLGQDRGILEQRLF